MLAMGVNWMVIHKKLPFTHGWFWTECHYRRPYCFHDLMEGVEKPSIHHVYNKSRILLWHLILLKSSNLLPCKDIWEVYGRFLDWFCLVIGSKSTHFWELLGRCLEASLLCQCKGHSTNSWCCASKKQSYSWAMQQNSNVCILVFVNDLSHLVGPSPLSSEFRKLELRWSHVQVLIDTIVPDSNQNCKSLSTLRSAKWQDAHVWHGYIMYSIENTRVIAQFKSFIGQCWGFFAEREDKAQAIRYESHISCSKLYIHPVLQDLQWTLSKSSSTTTDCSTHLFCNFCQIFEVLDTLCEHIVFFGVSRLFHQSVKFLHSPCTLESVPSQQCLRCLLLNLQLSSCNAPQYKVVHTCEKEIAMLNLLQHVYTVMAYVLLHCNV